MDMNDLLNIGANMLKDKIGADDSQLSEALSSILTNEEGSLDLSNILSSLQNGNIGEIVSSWIGSGENAPLDPSSVSDILGSDKIEEFASKLGVDMDTAQEALAGVLPEVVDKATPEGDSILEQLGGVDGLMKMAGKFFS